MDQRKTQTLGFATPTSCQKTMPQRDPPVAPPEAKPTSRNVFDCPPTGAEYLHVAKLTALVAGILLAFYLLYHTVRTVPQVFMIGFLGVLFAVFLTSLSHLLGRISRLGYRWNLTIVTLLLLAALVIFLGSFGATVYTQIEQGVRRFEEGGATLLARLEEYPAMRPILDSVPMLDTFRQADDERSGAGGGFEQGPGAAGHGQDEQDGENDEDEDESPLNMAVAREVGGLAGQLLTLIFGFVTNLLLISIVGLYLAASPNAYQRTPTYLFPPRVRPEVYRILAVTGRTLWKWLLGRLFSMSVSGIGTAIVLYLFGIEAALMIGAVTFLLGFIPNLGPLLAMGVAVLFVLPKGLSSVAIVVGVLSFFELLESYAVAPLVTEHQVHLPPALVIFFQALMGITLGFIGLTVAAPLMAVAYVLFTEVYRRRVLGEEDVKGVLDVDK